MRNIAIILVNYNGQKDTIECINSILKSELQEEHVLIVVVDNASTQPQNELRKIDDKIKLVNLQTNIGFSGGNNVGITYAINSGCDYIILLNNDTIVDKMMIHNLVKDCDAQTVTAPIMLYYANPTIVWYGGGSINKITGVATMQHKNDNMKTVSKSYNDFVTGCCFCIHRQSIERVGLLDESFFMYCEDTDYSIRLRKVGIRILLEPSAKLWHKVGGSSGGEESSFPVYYICRNRLRYIKKHDDYFYWTAFHIAYITRVIKYLEFRFIHRDKDKSKAVLKALKDYGNLKIVKKAKEN